MVWTRSRIQHQIQALLVLILLSSFEIMFSNSNNNSKPAAASAMSITTTAKTALVTGSTDGIGLTTAKHLAAKGYTVILHGRDASRIERAKTIVQTFVASTTRTTAPPRILSVQADISTVENCRTLAKQVRAFLTVDGCNSSRLYLLVNNAGVFEETHQLTDDGLETTFAVNVMAPFVITSHLLPQLLMHQ